MSDFQGFFEQPYTPTDKMTKDELILELTKWRNMWTWIDPNVQYWATQSQSIVRCVRRDYKAITGRLGQVKFSPTTLEVRCTTREFDYSTGRATYETKDVILKANELVDYEFIYEQKEVIEASDGSQPSEDIPDETPDL